MSEWWTYRPSDFLLFAPRTYYRLFELYNQEIWPLHIVALAAGVTILVLLMRARAAWSGRVVAAVLAACWLWVAWAFHWQRYATINWAADYFAAGFVLQALLLIWIGVARDRLRFDSNPSTRARIGAAIFSFALIVQPFLGLLVGRHWSQLELFGVAPDPTALATVGLLLAAHRVPWVALPLPVLWCLIGGMTSFLITAALLDHLSDRALAAFRLRLSSAGACMRSVHASNAVVGPHHLNSSTLLEQRCVGAQRGEVLEQQGALKLIAENGSRKVFNGSVAIQQSCGRHRADSGDARISVCGVANQSQEVRNQMRIDAKFLAHAVCISDRLCFAVDLHNAIAADALRQVLIGRPDANLLDASIFGRNSRGRSEGVIGLELDHRPYDNSHRGERLFERVKLREQRGLDAGAGLVSGP